MKTLTHNIRFILASMLFMTFVISNAQVTYQDQLEAVYLKKESKKEVVYTNNFSNFNNNLIASNKIDFRSEIVKAKKTNQYLLFLSDRNNLEILELKYLKTLRKGANRSSSVQSFEVFIQNNLPQLSIQFEKDNNLKQLYTVVRKDTFNGKIDALPGVL
ncbi:hypothetical protein [Aquimarina algicola]|uniref:Uncharacterized protein n=1 Tax=Aquimarina algicola TaxID=2589995 RepID=A0A504J695_9FLAO|nr:hypothetical protein [Aquimarina algicola]TPN81671.1 hypothetical protein FHK87_24015 [Aquimarina algicola]